MPATEAEALTGSRSPFRIEDVAGDLIEDFPAHLLSNEPNGRVLVLINPFSGQKRAEKLWAVHGAHVLQAAGIHADVIHTEHSKHATKIIQELDIDRYDAVLVNSGDGLVTEVRQHWVPEHEWSRTGTDQCPLID
ncbi:diacylglycerol kinase catalytic domain protein [Ancylostoma duodenale]|uniref:Diacylglycerol kinase catalytic domain protein n=1 Tax=Ancylostoma duodenale TaxID=51022 RepID=A0A0C2FXW6_9BILA|nr:diacylglycerol kinase catalytic domain protein [Ancylostoma duodenale]